MTSLVRAKLPNGDEATVGSDYAESLGLKTVDKPAVDGYGTPLPAKLARPLADLGDDSTSTTPTPTSAAKTASKEK